MRKVAVDLMIGRKSQCHFRKTPPKQAIIYQGLPVGTAVKSLFLSTLLNKYGLVADNFYAKFNEESKSLTLWPLNFRIPVVILISGAKTITEYRGYPQY